LNRVVRRVEHSSIHEEVSICTIAIFKVVCEKEEKRRREKLEKIDEEEKTDEEEKIDEK